MTQAIMPLTNEIAEFMDRCAREGMRFIVYYEVETMGQTLPAAVGPYDLWSEAMGVAERMGGIVVPLTSQEFLDEHNPSPD